MTTATMSPAEVRDRLRRLHDAAETLMELSELTAEWDAAYTAVHDLESLGSPVAREIDHMLSYVRGEHGHSGIGAEDIRNAIGDALVILDLAIERSDDAR